jgi:hypothetical protein
VLFLLTILNAKFATARTSDVTESLVLFGLELFCGDIFGRAELNPRNKLT